MNCSTNWSKHELVTKAVIFAAEAHKGQYRRGIEIAYIFHCTEVGQILDENKCDTQLVAAGVLHDILEDTPTTFEKLREVFGARVAEVVRSQTEDKSLSWEERKTHTIECLKTASLEHKLLVCADKLANVRSICKNKVELGDALWSRFNSGYEKVKWYYTSLVESLKSLEGYEMYREFKELVPKAFDK